MPYPIETLIPELIATFADSRCAVLAAATGSGKTTVLPLALLNAPYLAGRRILLLEPRRIATYAAAARLAENFGCELGATVGYRMRLEHAVSAATRLEVVTEGMLTRRLQHDPELRDVGMVIFDEFHERTLHAELGLALTLEVQNALREDLRILVMSATLDTAAIAGLLGGAPVLSSPGREYPVTIHYAPPPPRTPVATAVVTQVLAAHRSESGGILAFLPGEADIRRAEAMLRAALADVPTTLIAPLYGRLDNREQRRAIAPAPPGQRKIVLATAIAESSLTIDGVRVVVDGGMTRVNRFSPECGMSRLETVRISRSGATQRTGRAGRTEPGTAWRLWGPNEQAQMAEMRPSEISCSDLTPLALELAAWGVREPTALRWLEPPPAAAYQAAQKLLRELGALDDAGRITPHGRQLHELGVHPRLAHMVCVGAAHGVGKLACRIAGVLEADDLRNVAESDLEPLLAHPGDMAKRLGDELARRLPKAGSLPELSVGALLATAYCDRIGRRRTEGRDNQRKYLLANGRGAEWRETADRTAGEYIVAVNLENHPETAELRLAATVTRAELELLFADRITTAVELESDRTLQTLEAFERQRFGAWLWSEARINDLSEETMRGAVADFLRRHGLEALPGLAAAAQFRARVAFLRHRDSEHEWPDLSDEALLQSPETWLAGFMPKRFRKTILNDLDFVAALRGQLGPHRLRLLDELAPERYAVPDDSRLRLDYSRREAPVLAVRIQQLFGLQTHPAILSGRAPLMLELLSPGGRPVQVTMDLPGFWSGSYKLVRSELRGRYPKHDWPDDPGVASPRRRRHC